MTEQIPPSADRPAGQSPAARAWVARRDAAHQAIAADRIRQAEDRARTLSERERNLQRGSPLPLIAGIIVLLCLLLGALWLFLDRLTCDPAWSDKGLSSYCKPPP